MAAGSLPVYYVYVIFDLEGTPRYVGKGKGDRYLIHERRSKLPKTVKGNRRLIKLYRESGGTLPLVFAREGLLEVDAYAIEVEFILAIGRENIKTGPLYNRTSGGEGAANLSPEARERITASRRGKPAWNRGLKMPAETVAATALARRAGIAARKAQGIPHGNAGRIFSEDHRAKLSGAKKDKKQTPEHIAARTSWQAGTTRPPEFGAAISAGKKGKPIKVALRTPEWRANISAALQGNQNGKKKATGEQLSLVF